MHELLIAIPWIGALLVAYGLRRELAARGREIAAWWGLHSPAAAGLRRRRGAEATPRATEGELEELRRRYAQAPEDTRAEVRKLLWR